MELPKATNTSALSGAGVMRLFNKVGETVNKITYKMDESDPVSTAISNCVLWCVVKMTTINTSSCRNYFFDTLTWNV